jgi:hypothetical protein
MIDADTEVLLERIATALERIANHLEPTEEKREKRPAVLSTATYSEAEREKVSLAASLREKAPKEPPRRSL